MTTTISSQPTYGSLNFNGAEAVVFNQGGVATPIQHPSASVVSNALTITLSPTVLEFRSPTRSNGSTSTGVVSTPISLTIPSGVKLATLNNVRSRLIVLALNNAGTVELAVVNANSSYALDETLISTGNITTTNTFTGSISADGVLTLGAGVNIPTLAIGHQLSGTGVQGGVIISSHLTGTFGTAGSTYQTNQSSIVTSTAITASGGSGVYSATSRTNIPYRIVGYVESVQVVAGAWSVAPDIIQGAGGLALSNINSLGVGQTWRDTTSIRANNTTYTNTTGKPIMVNLYVSDGGASSSSLYVDGIIVGSNYGNSVGGYSGSTISAIVPNNSTFKYVLGVAGCNMRELR